jgi:thiopurine S-methyltransferase
MDKPAHLSPEYWCRRWLDGETGWHHDQANEHLLSHWESMDVEPGAQVFVPLCGKSLDMAWLAGQGYSVLGVEVSPVAIERFFAEQQLTPEISTEGGFRSYRAGGVQLLCGDMFRLTAGHLQGVKAVYDRASLVALDRPQRLGYASLLADILPPAAPILLVSMDYPEQQMQGPPHSVPETEVRELLGGRFSITRLHSLDLLQETGRYADRGLDRMWEHVYLLEPA